MTNCKWTRAVLPGACSKNAQPQWFARCRRRTRLLSSLAIAILSWRKDYRALSPVAWGFVGCFFWLASQAGPLGWFALPSFVLFTCLCVVALVDARYFILPDGPLVILALTGASLRLAAPWPEILTYLSAAVFGFLIFRTLGWAYAKARGFPGLGRGDAGLFALAGLWLGWTGLPSCLLVAALSAALAAALALHERTLADCRDPLPFGPHLALGLWFVWSVGPLTPA